MEPSRSPKGRVCDTLPQSGSEDLVVSPRPENCNFAAHFACPFPISPLVTNYVLLSIHLARSFLPREHSEDGLGKLTWALQDLCLSVIYGTRFSLILLCPAIYSFQSVSEHFLSSLLIPNYSGHMCLIVNTYYLVYLNPLPLPIYATWEHI